MKLLGFYQNVPKYVPQQYFSIGSDDDLVLPNQVKSTDDDRNLIISEGGHDTWACQISGHLKWLQYKHQVRNECIFDVTINIKGTVQLKTMSEIENCNRNQTWNLC